MLRRVYRQMRKHARRIAGREYRAAKQINIPGVYIGSEYGGWAVDAEGLNEDSIVYSCGLGGDISFDLGMIDRFGVQVHGFDPTPEAIKYIRSETRPPQFHLHTWGLSGESGTTRFRKPVTRPKRAKVISQNYSIIDRSSNEDFIEVPVRRIKTSMVELGHDHIDVLKLDIEGAEYAVVPDMLECGIFPRQILVEVHHHFQTVDIAQTKLLLKQLNDAGYQIFDIGASWHDYSLLRK